MEELVFGLEVVRDDLESDLTAVGEIVAGLDVWDDGDAVWETTIKEYGWEGYYEAATWWYPRHRSKVLSLLSFTP